MVLVVIRLMGWAKVGLEGTKLRDCANAKGRQCRRRRLVLEAKAKVDHTSRTA